MISNLGQLNLSHMEPKGTKFDFEKGMFLMERKLAFLTKCNDKILGPFEKGNVHLLAFFQMYIAFFD